MTMAGDGGEERARKRRKKLVVGEEVEVGYFDGGLLGSWHSGVVVECGEFSCVVEHANLFNDHWNSKLVETIPVSTAIEGTFSTPVENCGQRIRAVPPHSSIQSSEIRYGLSVDALVNEAWWEGVVFDHEDGSNERRVFFPDLGDQDTLTIDRLRLTQDWDEVSGDWKCCGDWLLLQVLQKFDDEGCLPVSIKRIRYDLRATRAFQDNIKSWTFGTKDIWHRLVSELIQELWSVMIGIPVSEVISKQLVNVDMALVDSCTSMDDYSCSSELHIPDDHAFISGAWSLSHLNYASGSFPQAVEIESAKVSGQVGYAKGFLQYCGGEVLKKPRFCSKALQDFILVCRNKSCPPDLRKKLYVLCHNERSHLKAVGWKLNEDVQGRKYYVSPNGKRFGSLVTACEAWKTVEENSDKTTYCTSITYNHVCDDQGTFSNLICMHNKAEHISSPRVAKTWKPLKLNADYCPEVVELYAPMLGDGKPSLKSLMVAELDRKTLAEKVKKHLLALGWKIEFRKDTILRFCFFSPQGIIYYSLNKVCHDLLRGYQTVDQECEDCDDSERDHSGCSTKKRHSTVVHHENCLDFDFNCAVSGKEDVEFREDEGIEPEYLPEAITEYVAYMSSPVQNGRRELLNANVKLLRLNAKKHLLSMGWCFWLKEKKTRQELCYRSPSGKSFHSLITACKAHLKEYKNSTTKPLDLVNSREKFKLVLTAEHSGSVKNDKQWKLCTVSNAATSNSFDEPAHFLDEEAVRESTFSCDSSKFGEHKFGKLRFKRVSNLKKKSMDLSSSLSPSHDNILTSLSGQETDCQQSKRSVASQSITQGIKLDKSFSPRVHRSSTRLQQLVASSSSQHSAKTVLSWLIDNDILLPRQKVYYMRERGSHYRKEGRINCDGIKCMCCKKVFNLVNFAAHGGNSTSRPSATIFLSDGRSLLQCQMQMMQASKHKGFPHMRLKGDYL